MEDLLKDELLEIHKWLSESGIYTGSTSYLELAIQIQRNRILDDKLDGIWTELIDSNEIMGEKLEAIWKTIYHLQGAVNNLA